MRRALLVALAIPFILSLAACSSSKGSSNTAASSTSKSTTTAASGATIGTGKSAADKPVCKGVQTFSDAANNVGTTAASWKAAATSLKASAAQISANPPASIKAAATAYAAAINAAAAAIGSASSTRAVNLALAPLVFNSKHNAQITAFGKWVDQNC